MNTKLTVLIAALCTSAGVYAQMPAQSQQAASGQSTANSGEQNATAMQNNSNTQNTATPMPAKHGKKSHTSKTANTTCTDGNATSAAPPDGSTSNNTNCNGKTARKP